jgi:hypothetical protein
VVEAGVCAWLLAGCCVEGVVWAAAGAGGDDCVDVVPLAGGVCVCVVFGFVAGAGDWAVVPAAGADCDVVDVDGAADGVVVDGVVVVAAGGWFCVRDLSLGFCANAVVARTRPTAVVIAKCLFMFHLLYVHAKHGRERAFVSISSIGRS